MTTKSIALLLGMLLTVLAGCGSNPTIAPYAGEDQGLVIFAADIKVIGDTELEYDYLFTVENLANGETRRMRLPVDEDKPYAVLGRLSPGRYALVQREDARRDGRGIRPSEASGEFEVRAGHITLPKMIEVEKKLFTRKVNVTNLSAEDATLIYDLDISAEDEFEGWSLYTED